MKIPNDILTTINRLEENGFSAFAVGGCVRDSLLSLVPKDWDLCTSAKPNEVIAVFSDQTVLPTGLKHGTVTLVLPNRTTEITTFRSDGSYHDGRHPDTVTFSIHIEEDLKRRDFTVNAMAYSPKHGLIDPYGGKTDLMRGCLRCVGDPYLRFGEDALRILRALRFAAVYHFTITEDTAAAMHALKQNVTRISQERITSEFFQLLAADFAPVLTQYPDILSVLLPEFSYPQSADLAWIQFMQNASSLPNDLPLRLAALFCYNGHRDESDFSDRCRKALNRLKCSTAQKKQTLQYITLSLSPLPSDLIQTRIACGQYGLQTIERFIRWQSGQAPQKTQALFRVLSDYAERIRNERLCCSLKDLAIDGQDLIRCGIKPGKEIGRMLHFALQSVIEEKVENEKNLLIRFLFS